MVPAQRTAFKGIYETGPLKKLLEDPGNLRYAGWDLTTGGQARIVKGEYLEIKNAERKLLRLYEDGSFFVRVAADQDYLAWGRNEENFQRAPRLNPLAVIEFSLNFTLLCSELAKHFQPVPTSVDLKIEIRNAFFRTSKLYMIPGAISTFRYQSDSERKLAPESSTRQTIRVPTEQLTSSPQSVAFSLVQRIYAWFGIATEYIPYVSINDSTRYIDENLIRNVKS
jgi:hypothetical protein